MKNRASSSIFMDEVDINGAETYFMCSDCCGVRVMPSRKLLFT